jgi:hypothetical protein
MKEFADGVTNAVHADHASHVTTLAEQTKATEAIIVDLTTQLAELSKLHTEIMAKLNLPATNFTNTLPSPPTTTITRVKRVPTDEGGYCHTHGYLVNKNHTSANCRYPKEGHQTTATRPHSSQRHHKSQREGSKQ